MRMIVIIVVALLVLGGGGAGAYYYFFQSAEASVSSEVGDNHKNNKSAKKGRDKKNTEHIEFVELDPLILPIIDNDSVSQVVSVVIALEVHDSAAAEIVKAMSPKLKDAYIQDMYGMLSRHAALKGGVLQVNKIKQRLNKISAEVLGDDVVSDVLLQVVQQRAI